MAYIQSKTSGETIHLTDSADSKVLEFGLRGKAEQNGEPTPDAPVDIEVAGASGSVEVKSVGKNLLKNTGVSVTKNGGSFTVNDDKSVTVNGTFTTATSFGVNLKIDNLSKDETYIFSGQPNIPTTQGRIYCVQRDSNDNTIGNGTFPYQNNGIVDMTANGFSHLLCTLWVQGNIEFNNVTFYPMIRLASDTDDTYEPYTETTATISTPDGLCGINGVYDEVVKYADGSGKRIKRIGKAVFDGSSDESWSVHNQSDTLYIASIKLNDFKWVSDSTVNYMCSHFKAISVNERYKDGTLIVNNANAFIFTGGFFATLAEWKAWLISNPITVYYELATPIITDLTAEEIAEIEKLHTFYPVTNISNDADCFMFITYNTFRYEWIEPKTDWKPTDRFNFSDYNRIKSNINWLHQKAQDLWKMFSIEDKGEDITSYATYWNVDMFNAFENNLEQINKNIFTKNYGTKQVFFENAPFIQYEELNRIESAMLSMYDILTRQELTIRRIPFRLGTFKEVRI